MASVTYSRYDFRIVVRLSGRDSAAISVADRGPPAVFPIGVVREWFALERKAMRDAFEQALDLRAAYEEWQQQPKLALSGARLERIGLEVTDPELAALPWERAVAAVLSGFWLPPVVRTTPVTQSGRPGPFTLPMRILQVGRGTEHSIARIMRHTFGSASPARVAEAVVAAEVDFEGIEAWRASARWPTAEILHFDEYPLAAERLLSPGAPDEPGTLGWLNRLTSTWQTRLVVLYCRDQHDAAAARRLGTALAARGGPAVLVADLGDLLPGWYFREFYDALIHDNPLESCVWRGYDQFRGRYPSLLVGGGREDALRFSLLGVELLRLRSELLTRGVAPGYLTSDLARLEELLRQTGGPPLESPFAEPSLAPVELELDELEKKWSQVEFEFHEGEGVLPLAERVNAVRRAAKITGPASVSEIAPPSATDARFVNPHIAHADADGRLTRIPQSDSELLLGETYHLEVDIGPPDLEIRTVGALPMLEEYFQWTPEMSGVWLEIGVTGIDFDVLGDPVQQFWLPRRGPSARAVFAIVPRSHGVSQVRFCVYHRNDLLQSFRIAAITRAPDGVPVPSSERASQIASALALPMTSVEQTGWLARLEYAIVPSVDVRGERGERALSILANQVDGRTIVTVKGSGDFNVRKDIGDPAKLVERVRRKLTELSEVKITLQGSAPKRQYSYGKPGSRNGGDEARLKPALMGLAEQGWLLFDAVFPGDEDERKGLMNALELFGPDVEDARTIHVAHTLLPKVIPWSAMYLREYDAGAEKTRVNGTTYPVAHDACTAALPDANGAFPSAPCGSLPTCPLHPDRIADHINSDGKVPIAKTVACPRYFLGFRHVLELPPQQVEPPSGGTTLPTASSARRLETTITAAAQPRFASGFHQQLTFAAAHETALTAVCKGPPEIASWQPSTYQRDDVLAALDDSALDLIYFFCHARGGPGYSRLKEPVLEFHPTIGNVGAFVAAQVKANWMHHPLVFMNGCNTAGFSPSTLSPFIRKFVHDCRAAGVIGTEVPVYEELASEVAEKFLASFLAGKPAGETMLRVRRALLHDQNPLGLVYTLYAAAELHIERSPTV